MKLNKIIRMLAIVALIMAQPSCNDDDVLATALDTTQGETEKATYNTLSFEWDKVEGATQYGYELYDNNDILVVRSVTSKTSVTISDLKPATEYTLKVWSYAALGSDHTTSAPIELKATTTALKALGKPVLTCNVEGGRYVITWKSVSNATDYAYVLTNSAGVTVKSGNDSSRSLAFSNLEIGDYTIAVKALSTKGGYESEGEYSTLDFTVEELILWKAEGTYWSEILGESWTATIVCYGDNNYSIQGWYGVEGYNLDFQVDNVTDPEDTFVITGDYDYDNSTYTYIVPTGRTDIKNVYVYPWWNYSLFSGSKVSGSVKVYVWSANANDYVTDLFSWKVETYGSPADDFVGTWNASLSGLTSITDNWEFEEFNYTETVEIKKVDEITISMPALYFSDETMNVTIDMATNTLKVDPMTVWTWYTFAGSESDTSPVIGRINEDGSFEFTGWNAWYDGFPYLENTVAKFSR
ncbi:MAG: fibronectin type III domain-containing protein [Muribaculaceae bacterium]|nr:fibronectin type III domain-containing protein [Muribaculaceae bacterium]